MKKLTKILTLSLASLALFACDDIVAKPSKVLDEDNLLTFGSDNATRDNYDNDFEVIYDQLVSSGTSNSTILNVLIKEMATKEVEKEYKLEEGQFATILENVKKSLAGQTFTSVNAELETIISEYVKDKLVAKAKGGSYSVDHLFFEEKLVNELESSLYTIGGTGYNNEYLLLPDSTFEEIFTRDYSDYIEKSIFPDLMKELLTSIHLYHHEYETFGRTYAREVKYIKLNTISTSKDSVPVLINAYLDTFFNKGAAALPTGSFDLNSLARIYKGVYDADELKSTSSVSYKENQFALDNKVTTKEDVHQDELKRVIGADGKILPLDDITRDEDLINSYTGSYSYPVSWGKELKDRELAVLDLVEDEEDLVIKTGGVSDLPSTMRTRLFSSSVNSYKSEEKVTIDGSEYSFLLPKSKPNGSESDNLAKYSYYDSSSSAYYIVLVGETINTSDLKNGGPDVKENEFDANVKAKAMKIARILAENSNNQKDAIIYYLDQYGLEFGDQNFYDYIESTYPDVVED